MNHEPEIGGNETGHKRGRLRTPKNHIFTGPSSPNQAPEGVWFSLSDRRTFEERNTQRKSHGIERPM